MKLQEVQNSNIFCLTWHNCVKFRPWHKNLYTQGTYFADMENYLKLLSGPFLTQKCTFANFLLFRIIETLRLICLKGTLYLLLQPENHYDLLASWSWIISFINSGFWRPFFSRKERKALVPCKLCSLRWSSRCRTRTSVLSLKLVVKF